MSLTPDPVPTLEPTPSGSRWGRNAALGYLALVAIAGVMLASELVRGQSGFGTLAISVLTAPWSGLLAALAKGLTGRADPGVLRVAGLVLVVLCALLNARILYGMLARAERDARSVPPRGAPPAA